MRTRRLRACVSGFVLVAMLAGVPAAWPGLNIGVGVVVSDLSLGEALLAAAIGQFFGLNTSVVVYYHEKQRLSLPEVLTVLYLANLAHVNHHRVAGLRARGQGWGRIAKDLGIHPGTFNKLRKGFDIGKADDLAFEAAVFPWFLGQYYGKRTEDVVGLRMAGAPWLNVFVGLDLSSKSGKPIRGLLAKRKGAESWKAVGRSVGVAGGKLARPAMPKGGKQFRVGEPGKGGPKAGRGGGKQAAKARGNKSGKGQAKAQGKGHGRSQGQGQGRGQGKGHGKGHGG